MPNCRKIIICHTCSFPLLQRQHFDSCDTRTETFKAQNQWQSNIIKGQEFIYDKIETPNIFVGSSLTFRLPLEFLPPNSYNLALAGTSFFEDWKSLRGAKPNQKSFLSKATLFFQRLISVFPENFLCPYSTNWENTFPHSGKKISLCVTIPHFPERSGIYAQNQRSVVSVKKWSWPLYRYHHKSWSTDASSEKTPPELFEKRLKNLLDIYNKIPTESEADTAIHLLLEYLNYYRSIGTQVIFIEMPFHQKAYDSNVVRSYQSVFSMYLSSQGYKCIKYPNPEQLETTDGFI